MTPARVLFVCAILTVVGLAAPIHADWTGSLGRYSRTLERVRYAEYQAELASGGTYRTGYDWNSYGAGYDYGYGWGYGYPYYDGYYWGRERLFYLDRMRHRDYRFIERRVRRLMYHPFPRHGVHYTDLRSPDFYMQHRRMERHLERRNYYRRRYRR